MAKLMLETVDGCDGPAKRVAWYVETNGRSKAKEFYGKLKKADAVKLKARMQRMATHGRIHNTEVFSPEGSKIFAFKVFKQRLACFFDGDVVVIAHGYTKKSNKVPPGEIERACRLRDEYFQRRDA